MSVFSTLHWIELLKLIESNSEFDSIFTYTDCILNIFQARESFKGSILLNINIFLLQYNGASVYVTSVYVTSVYGTSVYGTSVYGTYVYGTSVYGTSVYGTSVYGKSVYGKSVYGTSVYGTSVYGTSVYSTPIYMTQKCTANCTALYGK